MAAEDATLVATNTQLRDQAVAELQMTTVGWSKVKNYPPEKLATTHWGKAMALLAQITDSTYGSGNYGG